MKQFLTSPISQLILAFLFTCNMASAQTSAHKIDFRAASKGVQYLGESSDQLLFSADFQGIPASGAWLTISDINNNTLFEEKLMPGDYLKRFRIPKLNYGEVEFKLYGRKCHYRKRFQVNTIMEERIHVTEP